MSTVAHVLWDQGFCGCYQGDGFDDMGNTYLPVLKISKVVGLTPRKLLLPDPLSAAHFVFLSAQQRHSLPLLCLALPRRPSESLLSWPLPSLAVSLIVGPG